MVEINSIKLDKADLKILFELDKNCRVPLTKLSKKIAKSRQATEYRINQLIKKGVITSFNTSFNPHKIGYKIYKIYLKLRNDPKRKVDFIDYLKKSREVYWFGECTGTWDVIFGVFSKSDYDFFEFKNKLISEFNSIIINEEGTVLIDVKQYPKRYFLEVNSKPTMFAGELVNNELDNLDYNILASLVNDGRIPIKELSRKLNSTQSIINNKIKKLVDKGIIIQYRIGVDLNKLNLELYKSIITFDRYTKKDELKFLEFVSTIPNVNYLIRNMWSIELEIVVSKYQEYYAIIEKLKKEFPNIIRTIDSVMMLSDEWTPGFNGILKVK